MYDKWDTDIQGQLTIDDMFTPPERLFAVSKIFARARKEMTVSELKTFVFCLTQINWKDEFPNYVYADKRQLAKALGLNPNGDHLSNDVYRMIKDINLHSRVEFIDEDKGIYDNGFLITRVTKLKERFRFKFDDEYVKLFSELENDYITMWSSDIFNMKSERSITLYEHLRLHSDTRKECTIGLGVKAIKDLFGMKKEDYCDRTTGKFNRTNFEKKILDVVCNDLSKCQMIKLAMNENGKYYDKVKQGNRVMGYRFTWYVSDHPRIADGQEMHEIQKDAETLKIAKDIKEGKKKTKSRANFPQRNDYDFEEIEYYMLNH